MSFAIDCCILSKEKNSRLNYRLNEQFHVEQTNQFERENRSDDYEQCQRRHISDIINVVNFVFILQREFIETSRAIISQNNDH
jgi:hypothetical protein